jgi:hypothetical protein
MFRLLIKLVIAALLINATWRMGSAFWSYYQYEDALQQLAQFGERRSDRQLCDEALQTAAKMEIPVEADGVTVRRSGAPLFSCGRNAPTEAQMDSSPVATGQIFINAAYTERIPLFPRYEYPWEFQVGVKAWIRP